MIEQQVDEQQVRRAVERTAQRRTGLYAPSVLRTATAMAVAMLETGQAHGIEQDRWDMVADIPGACLDVIKYHRDIPQTPEGAVALLDAVAAALNEQGVPAQRDLLNVVLERAEATPPVGFGGNARLAVTLDIHAGWSLTHESRGMARAAFITAPHDTSGAAEVAALAAAVNTSKIPNPFKEYRCLNGTVRSRSSSRHSMTCGGRQSACSLTRRTCCARTGA